MMTYCHALASIVSFLWQAQTYRTLVASLFLATFGLVLASRTSKSTIYDRYPRIRGRKWSIRQSAHRLVEEGYRQITQPYDSPFTTRWWAQDYLILPSKYLTDVRHAGVENASFLKNFSDAVGLHHTVGNLYESDRMADILKKGLNPILPTLTELLQDEVEKALRIELGDDTGWKSFTAIEFFVSISHRIVCRLLAGEELCTNESFIRLSMKHADSTMATGILIAQLPLGMLREPIGWLISRYHAWLLWRLMRLVEPVVARRKLDFEMQKSSNSKPQLRWNDSIEWALDLDVPPERSTRTIALEMLHILEAAGGAPGALMTEMMFQLLVEPHYQERLRKEIQTAITSRGGLLDLNHSLPMMDSFIMEINRMYPVGGVTAARTVMRAPLVLHDGLELPLGTRFGFPCKQIQLDARYFPHPQTFDGLRFQRLNEQAKTDSPGQSRYAAAATSPTNLAWGFGKHACPGRFYAVNIVKMIYARLLTSYEFRSVGDLQQHPASYEVEGQFLPCLSQQFELRRLQCVPQNL